MLPFYFNPRQKTCSFTSKDGYVPIARFNNKYGFLLNNSDFKEFEDQQWIVTQFRNMVFLDQCYWK